MAEKQSGSNLTSVLVILLVVSAFLIGTLWSKVTVLEGKFSGGVVTNNNNGSGSSPAPSAAAAKESALSVNNLKLYAKQIGLDTNKFNSCVDSKKYATAVSESITYGSSVGVQGTPASFINGKYLSGAQPFENFKEIIDKELDGTGSEVASAYSTTLQNMADPKYAAFDPKKKDIKINPEDPITGPKNAKVTLVVFSDFECPFCVRAYPTIKQIEETYKDSVRVVFKQFPLTQIHSFAQGAAEASLCANEQGKFWEYHDKVFSAPRT